MRARTLELAIRVVLVSFLTTQLTTAQVARASQPQPQPSAPTQQPQESASASAVPEQVVIPEVNLEGLEPVIAEQLATLREDAELAVQSGLADRTANTLGDLARHYHAYEFYDAAAAAYQAGLQLQPDETSVYLLGLVLREQGQFEEALSLFSIIASRQPNYLAARYYQALTLFDLGRFDSSRAAIPENTDSAAFQVLLGRLAMESNQPQVAAAFFRQAIANAPAANRTYYLLAQAYRALGDREQAAEALKSYGPVGAKPADPFMDRIRALRVGSAPYSLAGRKAFAAGRYGEAVDLFRKALAANPDDSGMRLNLASALAEAGEMQEAVSLLQEVVAADAESATAQFNLGVLLQRAGQLEKAIDHLREAVSLSPGDKAARTQLVDVLARTGLGQEALLALEPLRIQPGYSEELRLLEFRLLVQAGDLDTATQRIDEALLALPNSGLVALTAARFFATVSSLEHRDGARAVELASLVYEATGNSSDAVVVAQAFGELGQCERASEWMQVALNGMSGEDASLGPELEGFLDRARSGEGCRP